MIYCSWRCTYKLITIHPCPVKVSVSQMCLCRCVHFTSLGHTLKSGIGGSLLGVSFIFTGAAVFTEMIDPLYTPTPCENSQRDHWSLVLGVSSLSKLAFLVVLLWWLCLFDVYSPNTKHLFMSHYCVSWHLLLLDLRVSPFFFSPRNVRAFVLLF